MEPELSGFVVVVVVEPVKVRREDEGRDLDIVPSC